MELDLLKNTWPTDLFHNPNTEKTSTTEEENSVFSIWEENYQDLSGWCIDTFQGRCAFPIGELHANEYSGTKSEDNGVSIKNTGVNGQITKGIHEDRENLEDSSPKVLDLPFVGTAMSSQMEDLQIAIKPEIIDTGSMGMNDILLLDPIDSSTNPRNDDWIQLANVDVPNAVPIGLQRKSINRNKNSSDNNIEYSSSIPHEVISKNKGEDWDTISTFDNTESETFDLLSYLCDDNIQSPDGSVVSRDSQPAINSNSSIASNTEETSSSMTINRRKKLISHAERRISDDSNSASSSIAKISAALDSVAKMSERPSRSKRKKYSQCMKNQCDRNDEISRGKKRCMDSDSEDRTSDGSYRESREKNNEASRKSRQNKKAKETEMTMRADELERNNRILKMKVDELDKLVTSMRTAILRSALKKSS